MTDKQIVETLRNIQNNCKQYGAGACGYCLFGGEYETSDGERRGCQIRALANLLWHSPCYWDMEEIERIINE